MISTLKQELLDVYLYMREHNHTVPDSTLDFIKDSPGIIDSQKSEIDALVAEVKSLVAKNDKANALNRELMSQVEGLKEKVKPFAQAARKIVEYDSVAPPIVHRDNWLALLNEDDPDG